ncbi:Armadillo-type fold [Trinorchestia longiramus]|nr:Armadillo-type fold [Trinorchestia longiramus]
MTTSLEKRRDFVSSAPFYTLPPRKTSAQIIKEARQDISLKEGGAFMLTGTVTPRNGVRTVNTKRPFTPRCQERTLFGTPAALRGERPPSSFTLSPLHFDPNEPHSRAAVAVLPLAEIREGWLEDPTAAPTKLPALCRKSLCRRLSLGELREESYDGQDRTPTPLTEVSCGDCGLCGHWLVWRSGIAVGVVSLPEYQKGLQQSDLTICDLDTSMEDASLRALLLPERPLKRVGPQLNPLKKTSFPPRERLETIGEQTFSSLPPEPLLDRRSSFDRDGAREPLDLPWGDGVDTYSPKSSRSGSLGSQDGGRGERSDAEQDVLYEQKVAPVLDEISRAVKSEVSDGVLSELVDKLYRLLEGEQLLERQFKHRSAVLRTVFRLVDREHGQLLASLARVMLALRVSGNNLTSVTKLVFKVTRDDANDHLFMSGPLLGLLLEAVGRLSPLESPEAAVYGYGALKFLTMNSALCTRLLARGVLELLTLHMMIIVNEMEDKGKVPEQTCYAMVQLTATLRHVSSCERTFPRLLEAGTVVQVCRLLGAFKEDTDVTSNLARILSIVTTQPECCSAAASHPTTLEACVALLATHQRHPAIVVRVAYALGNMMATDEEARYRVRAPRSNIMELFVMNHVKDISRALSSCADYGPLLL